MNPVAETTNVQQAALSNADFQFEMVDFGPSYAVDRTDVFCICICICICICACIIV